MNDQRGKSTLYLMVKYHLGLKMARKLKRLMAKQDLPVTHIYTEKRWRQMKAERDRTS